MKILERILFICGALCALYYLACGYGIRFGTAQLWLWLVLGAGCILLGVLIEVGLRLHWVLPGWARASIAAVVVASFAATFAMMGMVISRMGATAPANLDYLVVLGARVNGEVPSGALMHRIESAAAYLQENPDTLVIASGGQGEGEYISEAECIRRTLVSFGIDESRILMEDRSTSTHENLTYSQALMEIPNAQVAVVSNNFHVYRAQRLAEAVLGRPVHAIAAEFTWTLLPHYVVREAACALVDALEGHMTLWSVTNN